jgi:hypothetical protein
MGSLKAKDLISRVGVPPLPSKAAIKELTEILQHNDTAPHHKARVSWRATCALLTSQGFPCHTIGMLDRVCRSLGRQGYAKP